MLAQLAVSPTPPKTLDASHLLVLLPKQKTLPGDLPGRDLLAAVLDRRNIGASGFADTPVAANQASGGLMVWAMVDLSKPVFFVQTQIRNAMKLLLDEYPGDLAVSVHGDEMQRQQLAEQAVYIAWVNGASLPLYKKNTHKPLKKIVLIGRVGKEKFDGLRAQAEGNFLCRSLTILPPNELTPGNYRQRVKKLARENKWQFDEFDMKALREMGAGAFVAVAQGSHDDDAAIVRVQYRHPQAKRTVALVGKGICFDTGGHNLKPARHMNGMHEDMNGSAVALGILLAATHQRRAVNIDCWLAVAQNHIGPKAYKQNDIVTALNGTTIEIVHTDAEGRMVLADTLTLAARAKPDLIIDFATLTGSMAAALGARYSGVLGNRETLLQAAVQAGQQSGERLCAFPLDEDYEPALDSKVADIKQCTLEGEADHILAARFLKRFLVSDANKKSTTKSDEEPAWLHVDLSASRCEGGLGGVASDVTGFGVAWGLRML
jgi:leucyl aminopeptidase